MSGLFEDIPADILDGDQESLGDYAAYLNTERSLLSHSAALVERSDSAASLRQVIQTPQLTVEVREQIILELRNGEYPENAAAMAGIPTKIWREWMEMAVRGIEPYHKFWRECFVAEAQAQSDCNKILRGSEQGAKYLLERRFSRPSLAEDPLAEGPQWRKQTLQELTVTGPTDEDEYGKIAALKPKDRVKTIAMIAAALQKAEAIDGSVNTPEEAD